MVMTGVLPFNPQYLVLLAMGCASLALCLSFYFKTRLLRRLSLNSKVTFYEKTFNVVSLDAGHRRMLHTHIPLMLSFSILTFFLGYYILAPATTVVLGISITVLCVSLMMVDEAYEIHKNASIFAKAIKGRVGLGEGDMKALLFLNRTLPKLSAYYLLLTALFIASFAASPYLETVMILALSHLANAVLASAPSIGLISAFLGGFAAATFFITFLTIGGVAKHKVFGFPLAVPLNALLEQFERVHFSVHEVPLFELSHRPVIEDHETEERKRRNMLKKRK
jgi:hypothetical protein